MNKKVSIKFALFFSFLLASPLGEMKSEQEPVIRVLISDSKNLSFRADGLKPILIKGLDSRRSMKKVKSLKIEAENREYRIYVNGVLQKNSYSPSGLELIVTTRDSRGLWFSNRRYGGELRVKSKGDQLRLVNYLSVEKYLKSVVGAEMPKTWPLEALKAQAVASRTYALNQMKNDKNDFDVRSSERNQVYLGIESETNKIRKAVNSTRSLVIVHQGGLIDSVFHSSSGGKTEESENVWGKQIPYLRSVKDFDEDSPNFTWTLSFTPKELKEAFPEVGGFNAIRVINRTDTNRVTKALIYGPNGESFYSGKEIRGRLKLKSTLINFEILTKDQSKMQRSRHIKSDLNVMKFDDYGYPFPPAIEENRGIPYLPNVKTDDFSLLVTGSGSGHGVGMSQWGAKAMAVRGSGYKRIIHHYYKGVKITPFSSRYLN